MSKTKQELNEERKIELKKINVRVQRFADENKVDFNKALNMVMATEPLLQEGGLSYTDIAIVMGVSKQRVQQIEQTAIRKINHPMNQHKIQTIKSTMNIKDTEEQF